jgi:transcriptional regulator with XRE-family HTH domain
MSDILFLDMKIGEKLRETRRERGLTLAQVSEKSGVALATLSRIENDRMTGTVESHIKICEALGINLPELYSGLSPTSKNPVVTTAAERTEVFVHQKKSTSEMLTPKVLDKKMMPVMLRIKPDGATHKEETSKGVEKFVYILEGKVQATIGGETYNLNKGDTLYFDSSLLHYFKNTGGAEAEIICVISPPTL